MVTCHLGAGASLAAVHGGRSVDTTMGFTPVDGIVMATRPGSVAAMAAAMDGLDALVFTGGVGEHAPEIRAAAAEGLGFLGVAPDAARNAEARAGEVGSPDARVRTVVVTAREDLEIARQVRALAQRSSDG